MLNSLRKSAGSWVAKALFGVLILSFGVWGIGDVIRGGGSQSAAIVVGDVEVSPYTVRQQFDRKVAQMRQFLGDQMTTDFARQMGMLDSTVQELVGTATVEMAAKDMGLDVSQEGLRQAIAQTPAFQGENGSFSADQFRMVLAQNGYTEARYSADLSKDLLRARLVTALAGGVTSPSTMANVLYKHTQEQRTAESLTVIASKLAIDEQPSEDEIGTLYEENKENLMAPEYRSLVAVLLPQNAAAQRVTVSEQDIEDHYQANKDTFTVPEKRELRQVISQDKAVIDAIAAAVANGQSFDDAAIAAGAPAPISMGKVSHDGLPIDVADAVFALDDGAISAPSESPFGWHLFQVTGRTDAQVQELADVKGQIEETLRVERSADQLYQEAADLEDMLGGGATLEEAAAKMELPLVSLKLVDMQGNTRDGQPAEGLPEGEAAAKLLEAGFANALHQDSQLELYNGGYLIVRTDEQVSPAPRPLEEVKDQLVAQWVATQQATQAQEIAQDLLQRISEGQPMAELAADAEAIVYTSHAPVMRDGTVVGQSDQGSNLNNGAIARLFSMPVNSAAITMAGQGPQIIHLTAITEADPASDPQGVQTLSETLSTALGDDMLVEATNALGARYGVTVNQRAIEATF